MITLKSHGFKFSRPEANLIFDVSYFANPWREKDIREMIDPVIRKEMILEFMYHQEGVAEIVMNVSRLLYSYATLFPNENIQVAFCCSAGEYRSPAFVEMVGQELTKLGVSINMIKSSDAKL